MNIPPNQFSVSSLPNFTSRACASADVWLKVGSVDNPTQKLRLDLEESGI